MGYWHFISLLKNLTIILQKKCQKFFKKNSGISGRLLWNSKPKKLLKSTISLESKISFFCIRKMTGHDDLWDLDVFKMIIPSNIVQANIQAVLFFILLLFTWRCLVYELCVENGEETRIRKKNYFCFRVLLSSHCVPSFRNRRCFVSSYMNWVQVHHYTDRSE